MRTPIKPILLACALATSALATFPAYAMPGEGTVKFNLSGATASVPEAGQIIPALPDGATLSLGDQQGNVVIEWNGFNLDEGEVLTLQGGTAGQSVLNIDTSGQLSLIAGLLQSVDSAGQATVDAPGLMIANQNGVVISNMGTIVAPAGLALLATDMTDTATQSAFALFDQLNLPEVKVGTGNISIENGNEHTIGGQLLLWADDQIDFDGLVVNNGNINSAWLDAKGIDINTPITIVETEGVSPHLDLFGETINLTQPLTVDSPSGEGQISFYGLISGSENDIVPDDGAITLYEYGTVSADMVQISGITDGVYPNLFLYGAIDTNEGLFSFTGNNLISSADGFIRATYFYLEPHGQYMRVSAEDERGHSYWGNYLLLQGTGENPLVDIQTRGDTRQFLNIMVDAEETDGNVILYSSADGDIPEPGVSAPQTPDNFPSQLMFQTSGNLVLGAEGGYNLNFPGLLYLATVEAADYTGTIHATHTITANTAIINGEATRVDSGQGVYFMTADITLTNPSQWYVLTNENSWINFANDTVRNRILNANANPIYAASFDGQDQFAGFVADSVNTVNPNSFVVPPVQ